MSDPARTSEREANPRFQNLTLPFTSRSLPGKINITVQPNLDPAHAFGLDLIFPNIAPPDFPKQFFGFPVMKAKIEYPVAGTEDLALGYTALFGWVQFVRAIPSSDSPGEEGSDETGEWEIDIFPYAQDLKSPFCYWGYNPTAFDAPARLLRDDGKVEGLDWSAQIFLCVLEDAGMGKKVRIVEGVGFGWGMEIGSVEKEGEGRAEARVERKIVIKQAEGLDVKKEWNERLEFLRSSYPAWTFGEAVGPET